MAMSVLGILSSSLFGSQVQQLGNNLQSGNLSAAKANFAALQQSAPQTSSTSSSQSSNPIAQAFTQVGKDLQSGNVSAAQQDYSTIQQDFKNQASSSQATQGHHHHHHVSSVGGQNEISQVMGQLGQSLQSGNLSSAQQAYSTLQQDFQQFAQNSGRIQASQSGSNSISLSA
jgi:outer membrane protein assembly factor BamD (BamD/ComL family)